MSSVSGLFRPKCLSALQPPKQKPLLLYRSKGHITGFVRTSKETGSEIL